MKMRLITFILCFLFLASCSYPTAVREITQTGTVGTQAAATEISPESSQIEDEGQISQEPDTTADESITTEIITTESISEEMQLIDAVEKNNVTDNDSVVQSIDTQALATDNEIKVIQEYSTEIPSGIVKNIKYSQYPVSMDYLLITASTANIRKLPSTKSPKIGSISFFEKITLLSLVEGEMPINYNTNKWYSVLLKKGTTTIQGYILSSLAIRRTFQFQKMYAAIEALKKDVDNNKTGYISNYKNWTGTPPLYHGQTVDNYGTVRYQAAPAYAKAISSSEFRYMPDGTLVSILGTTDKYYKVSTLSFKGEYFVPKKYISFYNSIDKLTKVVVIDRKNQNEGVFEYINGKWNLLSYIYATTGEKAKYKEPTPLGHYMAISIQDKFLYLDDVTRKISGFAPYAIRFSGGAYIHGVPVDAKIIDGIPVFQPMQEFLFTIGTVPRSHKCVRNYTSHALYLYHWISIGKSAFIVIE